jgi:hypothetical protein
MQLRCAAFGGETRRLQPCKYENQLMQGRFWQRNSHGGQAAARA